MWRALGALFLLDRVSPASRVQWSVLAWDTALKGLDALLWPCRLCSVEAYDPREGRWTELTSMQVGSSTLSAARALGYKCCLANMILAAGLTVRLGRSYCFADIGLYLSWLSVAVCALKLQRGVCGRAAVRDGRKHRQRAAAWVGALHDGGGL